MNFLQHESNPNSDLQLTWKRGPRFPHPRPIPYEPISWPSLRHVKNQIQQLKVQASPQSQLLSPAPSVLPSRAVVSPQNVPQAVTNVAVTHGSIVGGQKTVTVHFTRNPSDPHFQSVNVYVKKASQAPVLVAAGPSGPLTFTVPKSSAPAAVVVQSVGNWGSTPLSQSPSRSVRLQ